jgi:hypothetical protein
MERQDNSAIPLALLFAIFATFFLAAIIQFAIWPEMRDLQRRIGQLEMERQR